jgi:hypothetical protein
MHSIRNSSTLIEQHADGHAGLERNGVDRIGLALEAGEGGARVGEGVDPDAEPRHAVAAGDADQAEEQDDEHARGLEVEQKPEVQDHDDADEHFEEQDELALGDQVSLARLVDQLEMSRIAECTGRFLSWL